MNSRPRSREVADGVWAILTTSRWLTVNAYLIVRGGTVALIDTGFPNKREDTEAALDAHGLTLADVEHVLYTHTHIDHMGGGVGMADGLRCPHIYWEGSTPANENYHAFYDALPSWRDWLADTLPDSAFRSAALAMFDAAPAQARFGDGELPQRTPVAFGASVRVGDLDLVCVDGRGHDPFHAGWFEPTRGWLFSGDAVLRNPTPLLPVLRDDISAYRSTLARWADGLDVSRLFPGHGRPRDDFGAAVAGSQAHLRDLYAGAAQLLAQGRFDLGALVASDAAASVPAVRVAFVVLGSMVSQLNELAERGYARALSGGLWEAVRPLPDYDVFAQG